MKRISVLQAITDFDQRSGGDPIAKDHLLLLRLAKYVEREIDTFKSHKLGAKLVTVDGSTVPEPDDSYKILKIFPGDLTSNISLYWSDLYTIGINYETIYDEDFIWSQLDEDQWVDTKLFDVINGEIVFPSSFNDQEFTIFYSMLETDEHGYMLVNESHIEAIAAYFKLFIVQRINYKSFRNNRLLRGNDINYEDRAKKEYYIARGKARAADHEQTPMDKQDISGIY